LRNLLTKPRIVSHLVHLFVIYRNSGIREGDAAVMS